MLRLRLGAYCVALLLMGAPVNALPIVFVVPLLGSNEVPAGSGDPDGSGTATITLDGATNSISWSITTNNITLPIFLDHIHQGAAGTNGPVVIDFSATLVGGPIVDPDVAAVLANPSGYYVNVHTTDFQAGAIRGQVPEPGPAQLVGIGVVAIAMMRRRARRQR